MAWQAADGMEHRKQYVSCKFGGKAFPFTSLSLRSRNFDTLLLRLEVDIETSESKLALVVPNTRCLDVSEFGQPNTKWYWTHAHLTSLDTESHPFELVGIATHPLPRRSVAPSACDSAARPLPLWRRAPPTPLVLIPSSLLPHRRGPRAARLSHRRGPRTAPLPCLQRPRATPLPHQRGPGGAAPRPPPVRPWRRSSSPRRHCRGSSPPPAVLWFLSSAGILVVPLLCR